MGCDFIIVMGMFTFFELEAFHKRFRLTIWLRYETDEISPEPKCLRNGQVRESNYYILSKAL